MAFTWNTSSTNNNGWNNTVNTFSNNTSAVVNPNNDHQIVDPPSDAVSCIKCHPNQPRIVVGSWDNTIVQYEFFGNNQSRKLPVFQKTTRPILDCCFDGNGDNVFCAGSDHTVKIWNPQSNQMAQIGQHQAPVRCVAYSKDRKMVISGSWDRTFAVWDPRNFGKAMFIHNLGAKVYAMALKNNMLVVGMSDGDIKTFDLRQSGKQVNSIYDEMKAYPNAKNTKLNHQVKCIDISPDGKGYVAGSIGGRVIIRYFNRNEKAKDFGFKCHRFEEKKRPNKNQREFVFSVNAIKFHQSGTFTTGGSDGILSNWDKNKRKKNWGSKAITYNSPRTQQQQNVMKGRMSVVALDHHDDGQYLVYAVGYDWNKGALGHEPNVQKPQIYLHQNQANEMNK